MQFAGTSAALLLSFLISLPLSAASPSDVLSEINLARTNPRSYAALVAASAPHDPATMEAIRFLQKTRPLPALTFSDGMSAGARLHVDTQGPRGSRGHGAGPSSRLNRFGVCGGMVGENIHYGRSDARNIVMALIIDKGVRGRGHRKNIFQPGYRVAGVASGAHATFGSMCVITFAGNFVSHGEQAPAATARVAWSQYSSRKSLSAE
jgi:hypothetical protein